MLSWYTKKSKPQLKIGDILECKNQDEYHQFVVITGVRNGGFSGMVSRTLKDGRTDILPDEKFVFVENFDKYWEVLNRNPYIVEEIPRISPGDIVVCRWKNDPNALLWTVGVRTVYDHGFNAKWSSFRGELLLRDFFFPYIDYVLLGHIKAEDVK